MVLEMGRVGIERVEGWGMSVGSVARVIRPESLDQLRAVLAEARKAGVTLAPRGTGCSYGDASTTEQGWCLDLTHMNRVLSFDESTGDADLEGGATIRQLWRRSLPSGYWPKVVSGTMFPTVGGAAGMNIHGKNNFKVGTFGDNLLEIDLLLANGDLLTCSREQNAELFHGAIGGFGMLGIITRVKTRTQRVYSGDVRVRGISCHDLGEMMEAMQELVDVADYLVGWIDTFGAGSAAGRGLLHDARYLAEGEDSDPAKTLSLEHQDLPDSVMGVPKAEIWRVLRLFNHDLGMRLINGVKQVAGRMESMRGWRRQSHGGFNFLLDYVPDWKYAYARRAGEGLIQYQAFLPSETALDGFLALLAEGQASGHVPYLGVLKRHRPDAFLMTHALDGWSLAMDLKVTARNRAHLWQTCGRFSEICLSAGGRFYFAKDQVISPAVARASFGARRIAAFRELKAQADPQGLFSTDLWRRVFEQDPAQHSHGPWPGQV
jgi:FAD/FMN-containing dehydrogenase